MAPLAVNDGRGSRRGGVGVGGGEERLSGELGRELIRGREFGNTVHRVGVRVG